MLRNVSHIFGHSLAFELRGCTNLLELLWNALSGVRIARMYKSIIIALERDRGHQMYACARRNMLGKCYIELIADSAALFLDTDRSLYTCYSCGI